MPHATVRAIMPATSEQVFALLHDYSRRLEWDTLLSEAYLLEGFPEAELGAVSVCRGRRSLGGFAMQTRYISFVPGRLAAVKLTAAAPFFVTFAASIRHQDRPDGSSQIEYQYHFTAKPRWLRWLLHPLMNRVLAYETRQRLKALAKYVAKQESAGRLSQGHVGPNLAR